jgi:hypothetical protein
VARRAAHERLERWYHLICWGVPCAAATALLLGGRLGPADEPRAGWCWIASHNRNASAGSSRPEVPFIDSGGGWDVRWVQLVAFYVPLAIGMHERLRVQKRGIPPGHSPPPARSAPALPRTSTTPVPALSVSRYIIDDALLGEIFATPCRVQLSHSLQQRTCASAPSFRRWRAGARWTRRRSE